MRHYRLSNGENNKQVTEITFEEAFKDELQKYVSKEAFDILNSKYDYLDANYRKLYTERMTPFVSVNAANKISALAKANKKLQSENAKLRNAVIDMILNIRDGQQ
jgi:hypothetical protein